MKAVMKTAIHLAGPKNASQDVNDRTSETNHRLGLLRSDSITRTPLKRSLRSHRSDDWTSLDICLVFKIHLTL